MSETEDRDWKSLSRDWQETDLPTTSPVETPADLRRRTQRFGLGLLALTVVEVLALSAVLFVFSRKAWNDPEPIEVTIATTLWILGLAAMGFSVWNRRGTWRPTSESTLAFAALWRKRCHRRLRGVRFGWGLLAVETLFFIPWIAWVIASDPAKLERAPGIYFTNYGLLAGLILVASLVLLFYRRQTVRELDRSEELYRALTEPETKGQDETRKTD